MLELKQNNDTQPMAGTSPRHSANALLGAAVCRPILFSTPMVQAILEGRKTQTRRIVNFKRIAKQSGCTKGTLAYSDTFHSWAVFDGNGDADLFLVDCPYGKVGDVLWVRETWQRQAVWVDDEYGWNGWHSAPFYVYKADGAELPKDSVAFGKWKPSIHMPKSACRLWLKITDIRVERLQDITWQDCQAEGVKPKLVNPGSMFNTISYSQAFEELWCKINGDQSWNYNPFVWVLEFERSDRLPTTVQGLALWRHSVFRQPITGAE